MGIKLDIATALISSVMIGVGIDYTIHFLWRFKEERSRGIDHKEAAYITLTTTGRGIIINALSVIVGFLALTLSNFEPLKFFGAFVVREGLADGAVAGSINTTGNVLRAGIQVIGLADNVSVVSSSFIMALKEGKKLTIYPITDSIFGII